MSRMTGSPLTPPASLISSLFLLTLAFFASPASASPSGSTERFSPRGFKGSFAVGWLDPSVKGLDDASASSLRLGYGCTDRIAIWLTMTGSEHVRARDAEGRGLMADVGGMDIGLQYAFIANARIQPYARVGLGLYSMENRDTHDAWIGSGAAFALGADYFFAKHWGIGAEAGYRFANYTQGRVGKKGDFRDLKRSIDSDAAGVAVSITVQ